MPAKKRSDKEELNLVTIAQKYADEDTARELLEKLRWPNGVTCPHCARFKSECKDVYKIAPDEKSKTRKGVYCCAACRKQFTVTVGTVFEGSHVPISKWMMAMAILCSSKKSVSSNQIHRMIGVTYKTAWFMTHRIRFAMTPSREHLWRYSNEFAFRWIHRHTTDGERMEKLIPGIENKRLTYRACV